MCAYAYAPPPFLPLAAKFHPLRGFIRAGGLKAKKSGGKKRGFCRRKLKCKP